MFIFVEVVVNVIGCDLQSFQVLHILEIDSPEGIVWLRKLHDQVLEVDELPEKVAFIYESTWPMQVQDTDALTDREVAAVCEQEGGIGVLDKDGQLGYLMQDG